MNAQTLRINYESLSSVRVFFHFLSYVNFPRLFTTERSLLILFVGKVIWELATWEIQALLMTD